MAKFYAMRIISGKTVFENVPDKLKKPVAQILIAEGHPELVTTEV